MHETQSDHDPNANPKTPNGPATTVGPKNVSQNLPSKSVVVPVASEEKATSEEGKGTLSLCS